MAIFNSYVSLPEGNINPSPGQPEAASSRRGTSWASPTLSSASWFHKGRDSAKVTTTTSRTTNDDNNDRNHNIYI